MKERRKYRKRTEKNKRWKKGKGKSFLKRKREGWMEEKEKKERRNAKIKREGRKLVISEEKI